MVWAFNDESVYLCSQDKETGFHKGFCWIGYTTEEGLSNVLQKDPHVLEGARVNHHYYLQFIV